MGRAKHLAEFGRFYDALSGEFLPPSDAKGRTHNLAALMLTTFDRGDVIHPNSYRERRIYLPSWAAVCSTVRVLHDDDISSLIVDGRINGETETLTVVHGREKDNRILQLFTGNTATPELTFSTTLTGDRADNKDAQESITNAAERFFNAVHLDSRDS